MGDIHGQIVPLNQWTDLFIPMVTYRMYCYCYISSPTAKNIIVMHTPILSIKHCLKAYQLLGEKYGFNIFAIDYCPGLGMSDGDAADFTLSGMVQDVDRVFDFIESNWAPQVYLLGYTGIGGVYAQYYMSLRNRGAAFAQFACCNHRDVTPLGYPKWAVQLMLPLLKTALKIKPHMTLFFKEPPYAGPFAEEDNNVYKELERLEPKFRKSLANTIYQLLLCIMSQESPIQVPVQVPTLVFKTLYDRYFPCVYFDQYFATLECDKKMVTIHSAHNSYYFAPELFCVEIAGWFDQH
jgi:hypothetical protein